MQRVVSCLFFCKLYIERALKMKKVTGYVDKIKYRNENNGYTVFTLVSEKEENTCVGYIVYIDEGEYLEVNGNEKFHDMYGEQIEVKSYEIKESTGAMSIKKYLASGAVKGIGEALAARIVNRFGEDTFRIIEEEPERLAEIKGISNRIALQISTQLEEKRDMRDAMIFLQDYGISTSMAVKIYNCYGSDLYNVIRINPYKIADDVDGIGFKTADEIAKKVGIQVDSDFRIKSGIIYTLQQATVNGHTYLPADTMIKTALELLEIDNEEEHIYSLLTDLVMENKIVIKEIDGVKAVFTSVNYYTETNIARMLYDLNVKTDFMGPEFEKRLNEIEETTDIRLDEMQREAVRQSVENGLMIMTGGPGTGKTTTINALIRIFRMEGLEIMLTAPTGRAAKRMAEATGYEAKTIHRLLELSGGPEDGSNAKFERNEENPLETDVVIVDEMSMVDVFLMHSLLKAVSVGTRLILVGDINQLPSVGPGNVLSDIINSGCFNVVTLNKIFRQAGESGIVINAHKINRGEHVALDNKSKDFLYINRDNVNSIIAATLTLIREKLPRYVNAEMNEIQVLTPMRKGLLGVENINAVLQKYLNPADNSKEEVTYAGGVFRQGDKVMQIKNNYQADWEIRTKTGVLIDSGKGVFNGEMGVIKRISHYLEIVEVEFDEEKFVTYTFKEMEQLELAYAVTIHKSQGSEYPAVIIPMFSGPKMLMSRSLLYTAITRAKSCVCIVGVEQVFQNMIQNDIRKKMFTGLKYQIESFYENKQELN